MRVRYLGRTDYLETWQAMRAHVAARTPDSPDQLWLTEHPPVFTTGVRKPDALPPSGDIPLVATDRGGLLTYHGPGQIIAYPLLDLRRLGGSVKGVVWRLEQAVIDLLAVYQVVGQRRAGFPGVFVGTDKIAALGLRVRRGYSYHGLSFNVDVDLAPYQLISPCGLSAKQVTRLCAHAEAAEGLDFKRLQRELAGHLQHRLSAV